MNCQIFDNGSVVEKETARFSILVRSVICRSRIPPAFLNIEKCFRFGEVEVTEFLCGRNISIPLRFNCFGAFFKILDNPCAGRKKIGGA